MLLKKRRGSLFLKLIVSCSITPPREDPAVRKWSKGVKIVEAETLLNAVLFVEPWSYLLTSLTHKHTYGLERSLVNRSLLGLKPPVQHTFESTRSLVWSPLMIRPRDQMLRSADLHRQENPLLFTKQLQTVWTKICVFSLESRIVYFWAVRESEQIPGQTLMEDCSCCCCVADALFLLFVQGVAGYTDAAK